MRLARGDGVGIIVPSGNTALEVELPRVAADRVRWHFTRIENYRDTEDELTAMARHAPEAAKLLSHASVGAIVFACTGGSFLHGRDYDQRLSTAIGEAARAPATTTSSAILDALRALGGNSVALFTPYMDWLTDRAAAYFELEGFRVPLRRSLEVRDARSIGDVSAKQIVDWIGATQISDDVDVVVISCTALHTLDIIDLLEEQLQRPVVTSNQATAWAACRLVQGSVPVEGPGQLFRADQRFVA